MTYDYQYTVQGVMVIEHKQYADLGTRVFTDVTSSMQTLVGLLVKHQ